MSSEFNELRELAREKRDSQIRLINEEYEATLIRIAELEATLVDSRPPVHKTSSRCIESVLPPIARSPFTTFWRPCSLWTVRARFTRLTNAHSKTYRHYAAMTALYVAWYNFCRHNMALKIKDENGNNVKRSPAMAAGLTDHRWTVKELLMEAANNT